MNERRTGRDLRAGDLVQVRSEAEILATLDQDGRLDGLPFMPEMLRHCGETLRVYRRADKTCAPPVFSGLRRMERTVFLDGARCDGGAHGGCQVGCLFFWKEAWLRPVGDGSTRPPGRERERRASPTSLTHDDLLRTIRLPSDGADEVFSCQATLLPAATSDLPRWDVRQYVRDVRSGNVPAGHAAAILSRGVLRVARRRVGRILGRPGPRSAEAGPYGALLPDRSSAPRTAGPRVTDGGSGSLGLQPGERVRVRSEAEIEATLDAQGTDRGLAFRPEMRLYFGQEFRVVGRVDRAIDERSGRLRAFRDCVILEGIVCSGDFARLCPRAQYFYWREAWLTRVDTTP